MDDKLIAVIANYGFSEHADELKARLSPHVPTLLIDNSSPVPPRSVDYVLPNRYYSGLWNTAVRLALERQQRWLLFIASDVQIPDIGQMVHCLFHASRRSEVGVYTPALRADSRAAYPACFQRNSGGLRECHVCEGFCFLARTEVLERVYPIDLDANRYGWGVDAQTCYEAYRCGYRVFVDDRVNIYHPAAIHEIPIEQARLEQANFLSTEARRFLKRTRRIRSRRDRWERFSRTISAGLSRFLKVP